MEQGSLEENLENYSIPDLMKMYGATLSPGDRRIYSLLKNNKRFRRTLEPLVVFGPKSLKHPSSSYSSNPLHAHSIKANAVLGCVKEGLAYTSSLHFREDKHLNEDTLEDSESTYDLRFLLPLVAHVLDEKNICDVVRVINNGWVYFIARGMALEDTTLRNVAFLAFKRLIYNLQLAKGFRLQDVKVWLHFLSAIKNGLCGLPELKIPPLIATWIIATCEVLKNPKHSLYPRVTYFLLAKPTIDLTILPDFTSFFNAEDGNRESRDWIMTILHIGLQTKADWTLAKKVPTIKYMCLLFPFEKIVIQRKILNILAHGANIPEVAHDLVDRHGILLWISNMKLDNNTYYRRELHNVYKNLSASTPPSNGEYRETMFRFVARRHGWDYLREGVVYVKREEEESSLVLNDVDVEMT